MRLRAPRTCSHLAAPCTHTHTHTHTHALCTRLEHTSATILRQGMGGVHQQPDSDCPRAQAGPANSLLSYPAEMRAVTRGRLP